MVAVSDWSRAASIRLRGLATAVSRATGFPRRVISIESPRLDPIDKLTQMCLGIRQIDCVHVTLLTM